MSQIRIQVGAALDANAQNIWKPIVESARKARAQIEAEFAKIGTRVGGGRGGGAGAAARSSAEAQVAAAQVAADKTTAINERALRQQAAARRRALAEETRDEERSANARAKAREHVLQIRARYEAQQQREAAVQERQQESFGRRTSYRTVQHFASTLRAGARLGGSIARGAGVDLDIGSLVRQAVGLESAATSLSNSAFQNRDGEKRVDPRALIAEAKSVANNQAFSPEQVLEGLHAFTAKTGELDVGRFALQGTDQLAGLAKLAKATGTSIEDMIGAAGEADKALGDSFGNPKEKAEALLRILPVIAAQGKLGSVEISDIAKSMGKVAASASLFKGSREHVIEQLGALAQLSVQGGGATSSAQAATSVAGFANILKTPTRVKAFAKENLDVFSNRKEGKYKDPFELIIEALNKTGGDPLRMKKLFHSTVGAKPVESLATTYRDAGGGKGGEAAVRTRLAGFMRGMTQEDIGESAARAGGTKESRVQRFNNQLAEVGEHIADRVLPQMERLAPVAIDTVEGLGKLAAWTAENPLKAVFVALGASVARGAGEAAIRSGVESAIKGVFGGSGGSGGGGGAGVGNGLVAAPGGKLGAALGTAGAAIAIAAAAFTIYEVGTLAIDRVMDMKDKSDDTSRNAVLDSESSRVALSTSMKQRALGGPHDLSGDVMRGLGGIDALGPTYDTGAAKDLQAKQDMLAARIANASAGDEDPLSRFVSSLGGGALGSVASGVVNFASGGSYGTSFSAQAQQASDRDQLDALKAEMAKNGDILNRLLGGVVRVEMVNAPPAGPPQPSGGRVGMDGQYNFSPGL